MRPITIPRRGATSMLAMIYLTLISTLALGFYTEAEMQSEIASADSRISRSLSDAESGLDFMRYQLAGVMIPPSTTDDQLMGVVYNQLKVKLENTPNLGSNKLSFVNDTIQVPSAGTNTISLGENMGKFRAILTHTGPQLSVKVVGQDENVVSASSGRAVRLDFSVQAQNAPILGYGVATKGNFSLSSSYVKGNPNERGSIFTSSTSTSTPVTMSGSASIAGDVQMSSPTAHVGGSGSIAGISNPALWGSHVQSGVPAPEFPVVDPSPFVNYLVGKETLISSNQGAVTLSNIRIKAGTNPQFSGTTIKGVVLIEAPNKVTFSGGSTTVTGVIVVDKPTESTSTNAITFSGGGGLMGPENLDASYGSLRGMTGSAILAPNFALSFTGGSGSIGGSVVARTLTFTGGGAGTVNGTVMIMGTNTVTMSGGSTFTIGSSTGGIPTGMKFTGPLIPMAASYQEVPVN